MPLDHRVLQAPMVRLVPTVLLVVRVRRAGPVAQVQLAQEVERVLPEPLAVVALQVALEQLVGPVLQAPLEPLEPLELRDRPGGLVVRERRVEQVRLALLVPPALRAALEQPVPQEPQERQELRVVPGPLPQSYILSQLEI